MIKTSDLREKEVINVRDGTKLGLISDIEVNLKEGRIESIMIPGPGKILGLFGRNQDYIINWQNIVRIGSDVILVDLTQNLEESINYEE
ncbi:putative sporulation protein YlmC/YmxH [Gottschalkia purinilytica]|uniref:Putative sporulation protein YlmC/YmxH n=1 Tax=Gottschalkia purinilytica TaxID=1503 RepID=A0A0L0WEP3_GOTPU|nr:YlmC/YmxH family sporulation protein [Gottschalkia purinilytica]KNF09911.1 putative sporulation protein YlmC/YmxH [Gottschalkia purinilytica]